MMSDMKTILLYFGLCIGAAWAVACGDTVEVECGEGTIADEESGQCVLDEPDCDDGQVLGADGKSCVREAADYCGSGTEFDESTRRCTAPTDLDCAGDAVDDDGECLAHDTVECGSGTVAYDGKCRPIDEVCGNHTVDDGQQPAVSCRPGADACGQGTSFDVVTQSCVRTADLECGSGTIEVDAVCLPKTVYFGDLAADPDLDATGQDSPIDIELGDTGERFVFVGNIDAPEFVDGTPTQHEDTYRFDADVGQWLDVTIYSLGLPEPGFELIGDDGEFYRFSDLGSGIEARRQVLIPHDGSFEMTVSNMAQKIGAAPPAGGDDWKYVGYIEVMESPEPTNLDIDSGVDGDIREATNNWYIVGDTDDVSSLGLLFDQVPQNADAELQVWSDTTTPMETHPLSGEAASFEPDSDQVYLFFDRIHAYGADTGYEATLREGRALDAGESLTRQVNIEAGQYIGFTQNNSSDADLKASLSTPSGVLNDTDALSVDDADDGQISLYWYAAHSAVNVNFELENDTGDDIEFVSTDYLVGQSESIDGIDGEFMEFQTDRVVPRGHRHYLELDIVAEILLRIRLDNLSDGRLMISDDDGQSQANGFNTVVFQPVPGQYVLAVEALEPIDDGFGLEIEETDVAESSYSSEPQIDIPTGDPDGVTDAIFVSGCNVVTDINMDVVIEHGWRGDLVIRLTNPEGDQRVLKARPGSGTFGDSSSDIVGNFNETLNPEAGAPASVSAEPIAEFIGSGGNGDWELNVADEAAGNGGSLDSWQLNLTCDA